jgi:phosphoglycolate phosphatase-like HAD superfamily hydrolase
VREDLSGQTEDAWEKGLSNLVSVKFDVSITVGALQAAMKDVLSREQVEQFTQLVKPVEMIQELSAALAAQGVPRHLCTTTNEHIIRPLLDHYSLLEGVRHHEFGAVKKIKDPEAPGGQVFKGVEVERCLKVAGVSARSAVMFGDSIADWGTAAAAGVSTAVLRPANFLVEKHSGYEGAALELKKQVEQGIKDYPDLADTKVFIVAGFDNLRVLPMRSSPENQQKRPTIVWTGELKS